MAGRQLGYPTIALVDLSKSVEETRLDTSTCLAPIPKSILDQFPGGLIDTAVFTDGHCIDFEHPLF